VKTLHDVYLCFLETSCDFELHNSLSIIIKLMSGSLGFVFVFSVNAVSGFFLSASFLFLLVTNDRLYE